jgi:hypothetical protein
MIGTDAFFNEPSHQLAKLALRYKVPTIYQYHEFTAAGGLMSYGGSIVYSYHTAPLGSSLKAKSLLTSRSSSPPG